MDLKLLEKYFSGEANYNEQQEVEKFFQKEQLDFHNEKIIKEWWQQYLTENENKKVESSVLQKIHREIERTSVKKSRITPWLKIAAVIAVFFTVILSLFKFAGIDSNDEATIVDVETISKETPMGAKLQFTLPDGSRVYLNAGSKITYPAQFSQNQRMLSLQGEAYFEVVHDTLKPFIVNCQQVATRVLGTSFNLSGYEDQEVKVSLTSGKVQVDMAQQKPVILQPGEALVYDHNSEDVQVTNFDSYTVTGWKDGILIFDENSLTQIINKLEYWYGVNIQVQGVSSPDQLQWDYSGEFDNENLDNVLSGIAYVKGFEYRISGKQVVLKF